MIIAKAKPLSTMGHELAGRGLLCVLWARGQRRPPDIVGCAREGRHRKTGLDPVDEVGGGVRAEAERPSEDGRGIRGDGQSRHGVASWLDRSDTWQCMSGFGRRSELFSGEGRGMARAMLIRGRN